jgi:hypothetical protein
MAPMRQWFVTVADDPRRTRDVLVPGNSEWSAGWLFRCLHPGQSILMIRPAHKAPTAP